MQTYFANQSCDPFTDRSVPCTLGNYVSYAVDVNSHIDIALALKFAKEHKLRVVVRNTGHEYVVVLIHLILYSLSRRTSVWYVLSNTI